MPSTTQEVLAAAQKTGELLAEHPTYQKLEALEKRLQEDTEAQRLLSQYERHAESLAQKQANGQPIEVEDKRKLQQLQQQLAMHPLLGELQMAQMDFLDLSGKVRQAIFGGEGDSASTQSGAGPMGGGLGG
jgi:cell fate (sporulation/competence/biofilm development) regulator YlbF (YheA/YmcA/DUF963 family)